MSRCFLLLDLTTQCLALTGSISLAGACLSTSKHKVSEGTYRELTGCLRCFSCCELWVAVNCELCS